MNKNLKKDFNMKSLFELYQDFKNSINPFMELTRGYTLPTSIAPWFVAAAAASVSAHYYSDMKFKLLCTFLTFIAVVCIHLGVNLLDDYIDVKKKLKKGCALNDIEFEQKARNKACLIINGTFPLKKVQYILYALFGTGVIIGGFFTYFYGIRIPLIALATGFLCLIYPYSSKFCLGEIIVGIIFGPLLVMGTYIALTGRFAPELLLMSVAIGLMIVLLQDTHNLMDYEYDKNTNKKTLCTILGSKKRALTLIATEILIAYLIIAYLVFTMQFSYWALISVLITLPLSIKLLISLNDYNNVKDLKFIPKWYLGPMENWDIIQKENLEYFMYRFYIARNIGFIFCMILAIVCFCTIEINYIYI